MYYSREYKSPLGKLTLVCDQDKKYIVGLWIEEQKYFAGGLEGDQIVSTKSPKGGKSSNHSLDILDEAVSWLDRYFSGQRPPIGDLKLRPEGTDFRQEVWSILMDIPYGQVTTYADIASQVAKKLGRKSMSAQAVGGAVGHNPISIIIPCHRVIGSRGSLIGYAGGMDRKTWLLNHEGIKIEDGIVDWMELGDKIILK
ncbi:methylated-DNA--[protein]-cysteine S-methyltransferase [Peptostreptococcus stomatis]|uniref:methylated-DNA--[protein]-cysteine S-methyltransferase n=1 Tax=Peptostreptococcus stomatis TaxID=341694 RepID=UPI0028D8D96E|nr:methylated-DNA--[protein]-cysteine S-methyltransferase [Peptostreptococcus stomatis]